MTVNSGSDQGLLLDQHFIPPNKRMDKIQGLNNSFDQVSAKNNEVRSVFGGPRDSVSNMKMGRNLLFSNKKSTSHSNRKKVNIERNLHKLN